MSERPQFTKMLVSSILRSDFKNAQRALTGGADPNFVYEGSPIIHIASLCGPEELVELLLDWKADINAIDRGGGNALMRMAVVASRHEHETMMAMLIKRGIDITYVNKQNRRTALDVAHAFCNDHAISLLRKLGL